MPLEYQLDNFWVSWSMGEESKLVKKSMKAIDEAVPPTTKIELQSLLGKINFIMRFILNLSERVLSFSPLLKLKMIKNLNRVTYNKRRLRR